MERLIIKLSFLSLMILPFCTSCYYDKLENFPNTNCDTTNLTYTKNIQPILSTYCTTCHSGASPLGGLDLSTYQAVNTSSNNTNFMGAINHSAGFSAMPKGTSKLDACTISKIQAWINAGKPQ